MERVLRFESIIAICALLISAVSGAAVIYQTQILREQYSAGIWPYLSVDTNVTNAQTLDIELINKGLGPALIRSASLVVDGKRLVSWNQYVSMVAHEIPPRTKARFSLSSISASTAIRPGDSQHLITAAIYSGALSKVLIRHKVALEFCYCSLNDTCWRLHSVLGGKDAEIPQRVRACPINQGIATEPY